MKIQIDRFARASASTALVLAAMATPGVASAADGDGARVQDCKGVSVELVSLAHTAPGDVTAEFQLLNTSNDDLAMFVYYNGANGKNTFLIDDSGTEWPKKRQDGNGNHRQALMAGVKTKYKLVFHVASGGNDAKTFQVVEWAQLLPLTGRGEVGWCKFQFKDVPAN